MANFLWGGCAFKKGLHLARWDLLTRPYEMGGWNIKDLNGFNDALRVKILWSTVTGSGIWNRVLKVKYLKTISLTDWLRRGPYFVRNASIIGNGFLRVLGWICKSLC